VWGETYVELSTSAAAFSGFGFEVVARGTRGELRFDPTARLRRFVSSEGVSVCASDVDAKYDSRPGSSLFSRSTTYLADAIVAAFPGGRPPADAASTRDAVEVSSILDACYESAQNGRVVDLASVSKFRLDAF
jgi:predicted dehydrogenase